MPLYCYEDSESKCHEHGRLYAWDSARRGCEILGRGWRLPTDNDWRLAKPCGGISEDAKDRGKAAYGALLIGGESGFDALVGGGRVASGQYARLEAHGFYWTAAEDSPASVFFYNFGKGGLALHRQREKQCIFRSMCLAGRGTAALTAPHHQRYLP